MILPLLEMNSDYILTLSVLLTLSTRDPFDTNPPEDEHSAVVVDMEEADLAELLSQDEKNCVQVFYSFGYVVPPKS